MITPLERVQNLLSDLRMSPVDFDMVFSGKNDLTPLEAVELFLLEQQRMRIEKQNFLRRRRAALPAEKTLHTFDFGFQKSVSKEQMLRLSDMTWVEQAYNICFLGPPGVGKTHLALSLAVRGLDLGYTVALETLDNLMTILKTVEISKASKCNIGINGPTRRNALLIGLFSLIKNIYQAKLSERAINIVLRRNPSWISFISGQICINDALKVIVQRADRIIVFIRLHFDILLKGIYEVFP